MDGHLPGLALSATASTRVEAVGEPRLQACPLTLKGRVVWSLEGPRGRGVPRASAAAPALASIPGAVQPVIPADLAPRQGVGSKVALISPRAPKPAHPAS